MDPISVVLIYCTCMWDWWICSASRSREKSISELITTLTLHVRLTDFPSSAYSGKSINVLITPLTFHVRLTDFTAPRSRENQFLNWLHLSPSMWDWRIFPAPRSRENQFLNWLHLSPCMWDWGIFPAPRSQAPQFQPHPRWLENLKLY